MYVEWSANHLPPGGGHQGQPETINPTLDRSTRYPLPMGGLMQHEIQKFASHFDMWKAVGIEPQIFWYWVKHPIHSATFSQLMSVIYKIDNRLASFIIERVLGAAPAGENGYVLQ